MESLFFTLLSNLADQPQMLFLLAIEGMNHYFKKGALSTPAELIKIKELKWPQALVMIGNSFMRSLPSVLIAATLFI